MNCITSKFTIITCMAMILITVSIVIWEWGYGEEKKVKTIADSTENAQVDSVGDTRKWNCGSYAGNVIATLNDSGTLVVNGTGAMADYRDNTEQFASWYNVKDNITSVIIGYGVTNIGKNAFQHMARLTSVAIPNGVEKIGDGAFSACSSLTSVMLPNSVKYIGLGAFEFTGLTSVRIPDSVTFIGAAAFAMCRSLTSVTISGSVKYIGELAFMGTGLTSVTIPSNVGSIGDGAFAHCTSLTSIIVQNPRPLEEHFVYSGFEAPDMNMNKVCLYVPMGSIAAYRASDTWKGFKCVKDIASAPK